MKKFKEFFINIWWALTFSYKADVLLSSLNLVVSIFSEIFPIVSSYVKAMLFTSIANVLVSKATFQEATNNLLPVFSILLLTEIAWAIIGQLSWTLRERIGFKQRTYIEEKYIGKLKDLDIQQFDSPEVASIIKKAEDNVWKMSSLSGDLLTYLARMAGGLTSFIILLNYNPLLVFLGILLSLPMPIADNKFNRASRKIYDDNAEKWREYWSGRWFLTVKDALLEMKVLTIANKLYANLINFRKSQDSERFELFKKYNRIWIFLRTSELYYFVSLFIIVRDVINKSGTIGDISFYSDQVGRVSNFISNTLKEFVSIYDKIIYLIPVKKFFELNTVLNKGTKKVTIESSPIIEFKNVSFKYPNSERYSLKNINFVLKPNDEVAIVGENGAGKTTLIKLLLRVYDPSEGDIFVNGINLKEIDLNSYYQSIGALFQDYYYLGFKSIRDNISYAKSKFSNMTIEKAAQLADLEKTILSLPKGYDTISTSDFENGVNLSRGQGQKLVIARLFYRNSPILILDEPTASIDAISEAKIFNRVYKFMSNKTVIIISHRFSTVRNAQRIFVLNKGEIVEQGTHEELLNQKGLYHKSFTLQAEGYSN